MLEEHEEDVDNDLEVWEQSADEDEGVCTGPGPEPCQTGVDCDRAEWQKKGGGKKKVENRAERLIEICDKFGEQWYI